MKITEKPQRSLGREAATRADRGYMFRNADLTQPLVPLAATVHRMEGWERETEAILPEITGVIGPRITYAQITRDEISELFERVAFGGVSFGVIRKPENLVERAKLVPLSQEHLPYITPEKVILADVFRIYVAQAIEQLKEDPRREDPRHHWWYIRCGRQILAALEIPGTT